MTLNLLCRGCSPPFVFLRQPFIKGLKPKDFCMIFPSHIFASLRRIPANFGTPTGPQTRVRMSR